MQAEALGSLLAQMGARLEGGPEGRALRSFVSQRGSW